MSAIQGVSSSAASYRTYATQNASRTHRNRQADDAQFQATFAQDLTQSGLNASVSPDDLLKSIQSDVKSAVNDPSNSGKDILQVVQDSVQKTLKANGVDTDKLSSLLQSQTGGAPVGAPPQGLPPQGPPPGGPGQRHHHHITSDQSSNASDSSSTSSKSSSNDTLWASILDSATSTSSDSTTKSSSTASTKATNSGATSGSTHTGANDHLKTFFERQIANVIKSLPSGTALDVRA